MQQAVQQMMCKRLADDMQINLKNRSCLADDVQINKRREVQPK